MANGPKIIEKNIKGISGADKQVMEGITIKIVTNTNTVTSDTQGKEFVHVPSIAADTLKEKKTILG